MRAEAGFPGRQLKFIAFQFEKCHVSLCFTVFCVLLIAWEYRELVPHADNISGICCPLFQCFLSSSSSSTYVIFAFPIGSFDRHKNVIIHQRTMGEMNMSLSSLHIHKAVLKAFVGAQAPFTLCRWHLFGFQHWLKTWVSVNVKSW